MRFRAPAVRAYPSIKRIPPAAARRWGIPACRYALYDTHNIWSQEVLQSMQALGGRHAQLQLTKITSTARPIRRPVRIEMTLTVLQPVEVKALLKGPDRDKVLVVDVREDDFYGGHIKGCVHHPIDNFSSDYDIDVFIDEKISPYNLETVVVHCYLSQQRGPLAARRLSDRLAARGIKIPYVCVMAHGFRRFMQMFADDSELVEYDSGDETE